MKLFNAQSVNHVNVTKQTAVNNDKNLDAKVLVAKDLLATVAGGINETIRPWPPVKPQ